LYNPVTDERFAVLGVSSKVEGEQRTHVVIVLVVVVADAVIVLVVIGLVVIGLVVIAAMDVVIVFAFAF
jgi:hypothetical protein